MKKFLLIFLIIFSLFVIPALYFLDRAYFLCPIEYNRGIIIRNDELGEGVFGAGRANGRIHRGIDLYAPLNTEVRAVRFAWVAEVGSHKGLGNYVELHHLGNLATIYGHLQEILVRKGQLIPQGMIIGYVGKTGNAKNYRILPHLHFEIIKDNTPIDPLVWLEG